MRHPLAGPVNVSLEEICRGIGPLEEGRVRAALADGLSVARYGSTVLTYGGRTADLPGQPPARLGGHDLIGVIVPGGAPGSSGKAGVSALKAHLDSAPRNLSAMGGGPRRVQTGNQQPVHTEIAEVRTGSSRTSPDPRSGVSPTELVRALEPEEPNRQLSPAEAWYRARLGR